MARKYRSWTIAAALVIPCVLAVSIAAARLRSDPAPPADRTLLTVEVVPVTRGELTRVSTVTGTLVPASTVTLTPKVAGRVESMPVELGQRVLSGDLILKLETRELEIAVVQARGALDAASANHARLVRGASEQELDQGEAALAQAQAAYVAAQQNFARAEHLYGEGAISRQQFEAAETQLKVASAQLTMAERQLELVRAGPPAETLAAAAAGVTQAQAAYDLARARLADAVLASPLTGYVAHTGAVPGELVSPGVPVAVIVDLDQVYAEAGLPESLVTRVAVGDVLPVRVRAVSTEPLAGVVTHLAPAADSRTRLFRVRVRLDNPQLTLRPGMVAELELCVGAVSNGLLVPRTAILTKGATDYIFVVADGVARRRRVEVGLLDAGYAEIISGLEEGELVVTSGASYLEDGVPVNTRSGIRP